MCCNPECLQDANSSNRYTRLHGSWRNSNKPADHNKQDQWCYWGKYDLDWNEVFVNIEVGRVLTGTSLIYWDINISNRLSPQTATPPTFSLHSVITCVTWLSPIVHSYPPWLGPIWPPKKDINLLLMLNQVMLIHTYPNHGSHRVFNNLLYLIWSNCI